MSVLDKFSLLETYKSGEDVRHGSGSERGVLGPNGLRAWTHKGTGVRVVRFAEPGPLFSVAIVVGSVPWSDAGHPHTLEHIVFLGSKLYERGYLDNLSCRSLGEGTNAYTADEYTCYTASCAGFEGMQHLLPVFIDHVLRPLIDEAAFASEVYHVQPSGAEAGVLLSELQPSEHAEHYVLDREIRRTLLAGTPLRYVSGGTCEGLRTLTCSEVQRYHREHYCGANVSVVVGGNPAISDERILESCVGILDDCAEDPNVPRGEIAWNKRIQLATLPPLQKRRVRFPSADEELGTVSLSWRMPGCEESETLLAIEVILRYLCDAISSPLQQRFVMLEEPLASEISYDVELYLEASTVSVLLYGVPHRDPESEDDDFSGEDDNSDPGVDADAAIARRVTEDVGSSGIASAGPAAMGTLAEIDRGVESGRLETAMGADDPIHADGGHRTVPQVPGSGAESQLVPDDGGDEEDSILLSGEIESGVMACLSEIVTTRTFPGGFEAVQAALTRYSQEQYARLECDGHEVVTDSIVSELVYSDKAGLVLGQAIRGEGEYVSALASRSSDYWIDLIRELFVEAPRVEITMVPDLDLADQIAEEEAMATEKRAQSGSSEGLQSQVTESRPGGGAALAETATKTELPKRPTTDTIMRLPYTVSRSSSEAYVGQSVAVDTDLVHATMLISVRDMTLEQRICLPILADVLMAMDVETEDGTLLPYTESTKAMDRTTVATDLSGTWIGQPSRMQIDCIGFHYASTADYFGKATEHMLQALFYGRISDERLSSTAHKLASDVVESLRDGVVVLEAAMAALPGMLRQRQRDGADVWNSEVVSIFGKREFLESVADEYSREKTRPKVVKRLMKNFNSALDIIRRQRPERIFTQISTRDPDKHHLMLEEVLAGIWRPEESTSASKPGAAGPSDLGSSTPVLREPRPLFGEMLEGAGASLAVGVAGVESSFLEARVDCAIAPGTPEWAATLVLLHILSRVDGPLYSAVRDAGLAYHVSLNQSVWDRALCLAVHEAAVPHAAWTAACRAIREVGDSLQSPEPHGELTSELETAKSSVLFSLIQSRSTPVEVMTGAFSQTVLGLPCSTETDRAYEAVIEAVDLAAVQSVFEEHVARLLQPQARLTALVCSSASLQETITPFRDCPVPLNFEEIDIDDIEIPAIARATSSIFK